MTKLSKCPHCGSIFEITDEIIAVRNGLVRCGSCNNVFNAKWNLVEEVAAKNGSTGETQYQQQEYQEPLIEQERLEQERLEQERLEQERAEQERAEQERADQERAEQERVEQERLEQERTEQERAEQERLEQERAEQERAEQERAEQERAEQERLEQERSEQERLEQERLEQERLEQERLEQERLEQERLEQERAEQERAEQERAEQERAEQERAEQERAEQERAEQERLEQERIEQERAEQERAEQERLKSAQDKTAEVSSDPNLEVSQSTDFAASSANLTDKDAVLSTDHSLINDINDEGAAVAPLSLSNDDTELQATPFDIEKEEVADKLERREPALPHYMRDDGLPNLSVDEDGTWDNDSSAITPLNPFDADSVLITNDGTGSNNPALDSAEPPKLTPSKDTSEPATTIFQRNEADLYLRDKKNPLATLGWGLITAVLLFLLGYQVEHSLIDRYAQDHKVRPYLSFFCKVARCELPLKRSPSEFTIVHTSFDHHLQVPGALKITVILSNEAGFSQPFPNLELTLSNPSGLVVGRRTLTPEQYLLKNQRNLVAANDSETVILNLVNPHVKAVKFDVSVVNDVFFRSR